MFFPVLSLAFNCECVEYGQQENAYSKFIDVVSDRI